MRSVQLRINILGPNGSGKTCVAALIKNLLENSGVEVSLKDDDPLNEAHVADLARAQNGLKYLSKIGMKVFIETALCRN